MKRVSPHIIIIKLLKKTVVDVPTAIIYVAVTVLATMADISPIVFVVLAAFIGVLLKGRGEAAK